jgi:hypothetical protein
VFDSYLVVDDQSRVIEEGGKVVKKIWQQLEDEGWFTPTATECL